MIIRVPRINTCRISNSELITPERGVDIIVDDFITSIRGYLDLEENIRAGKINVIIKCGGKNNLMRCECKCDLFSFI